MIENFLEEVHQKIYANINNEFTDKIYLVMVLSLLIYFVIILLCTEIDIFIPLLIYFFFAFIIYTILLIDKSFSYVNKKRSLNNFKQLKTTTNETEIIKVKKVLKSYGLYKKSKINSIKTYLIYESVPKKVSSQMFYFILSLITSLFLNSLEEINISSIDILSAIFVLLTIFYGLKVVGTSILNIVLKRNKDNNSLIRVLSEIELSMN